MLEVKSTEPVDLVWRWTYRLTSAAAWLEALGLAHGDIRPPNLVLDAEDHLKLLNFDCTAKLRTPSDGTVPILPSRTG